jgi:dienelactone hydrolase
MRLARTARTVTTFLFFLSGFTASTVNGQASGQQPPRLEVLPQRALHEQPVSIRVSGLQPGEEVTLLAEMTNYGNAKWKSSATFHANSNGVVDLGAQAPVAGSYHDVDAMGLFWSMVRVEGLSPKEPDRPQFSGVVQPGEPVLVTVTVRAQGRPEVKRTVERLFADSDVERRTVLEDGVVGTLFVPDGSEPHGALIVPHGGVLCMPPEQLAASLAAYGFVTLALQYCGAEGLPEDFSSEIPLEYFDGVIRWLGQRAEVAADRIGIVGMSTGGVVALQVATHFSEIAAVVSIKSSGLNSFNFAYRGAPVPRLPELPLTPTLRDDLMFQQPARCKPGGDADEWSCFDRASLFLYRLTFNAFGRSDVLGEAVIPVERINGPVLLISGIGDLALPATLLSEIAYKRLEESQFAFDYEHIALPGAGHRLGVPNVPRTDDKIGSLLLGGNAKDAAAANVEFWPRMIEFLQTHLGT